MRNNFLMKSLILGLSFLSFIPNASGQVRGNRSARVYRLEQKASREADFSRRYPALPAQMNAQRQTLLTMPSSKVFGSKPRMASVVTYDGTVLVGNMIYASGLTTSDISLYSFPVVSGTTAFTNITGGQAFRGNGGGIYSEDKSRYYLVEYISDATTQTVSSMFAELNTSDWSIVRTQSLPDNDGTLLAMDLTRDPVSHQVYGVFLNKAMTNLELGVVDYTTLTRTTIGTLDRTIVALAADTDGQLWGISTDGNLYQINKETAATTKVGPLGITVSSYTQSATFYGRMGILYFSQFSNGASALYEVDTTTGAATLATTYPDNAEIIDLEVAHNGYEQDAPAKPEHLTVLYNSLPKTAQVRFTVPTLTAGGSALTGDVTYHVVTSDGQDIIGHAAAGAEVSENVTFTKNGQVSVYVYLSNDQGDGPESDTSWGWAGPDQPEVVGNALFTLTDNQYATVTWTAPKTGVNGAVLDSALVEYEITRQPDGKTFRQTGLTSLKDTITPSHTSVYYYDIKALYGGEASKPTRSNKIKVDGPAFEVPFADGFSTDDDFALFDVKDLDADGVTWTWNDMIHCATIGFSSSVHKDLLVSPAIHLVPGKYYRVAYDIKGLNSQNTEKYRVTWGDASDDAESYTDEITPGTSLSSYQYATVEKTITVDRELDVRLAFWALSDANQGYIYLDNVKVDLLSDFNAPAKPEITLAKAGEKGTLNASLSFVLPSKTAHGEDLAALDSAVVKVDGVTAKTYSSVAPGQTLSATIDVAANGYHKFEVNCYNAYGSNAVDTTLYVGLDVPAAPLSVVLADKGDYLSLNWLAPGNVGARGGYVDTSNLTYNIGSSESSSTLEAENVTGNSYEAHPTMTGDQRMVYYGIQAQNEVGAGNWALSNYLLIGDAYTLPFKESFPSQTPSHEIWVINDQNAFIESSLSQDNDGGAMVMQSDADSVITLESGKIALGDADSPMLSFWFLNHQSDSKLNVKVAADGGEAELVKTVAYDASAEADSWRKVVVPLSDFKGSRYVRLLFQLDNDKKTLSAFDNIVVENRYMQDVAVSQLNVPNEVVAGDTVSVIATVENKGYSDVKSLPLTVEVNGRVVATDAIDLASGETVDKEFKFKSDAAMRAQSKVLVSADLADDGDLTNDTLSATFNVKTLDLPTVTDLAGTLDEGGKNVTLTWSRPDYSAPVTTTDDFEDYEPWTLNEFGGWTSVNNNPGTACAPFANGSTFTHSGEEFASIIFQPYVNNGMAAHSGDNCAAVFDNDALNGSEVTDKYLISPELSGDAQTVSMWLTNAEQWMPESYSIMYSTTGKDIADFKDAGVSALDKDFGQQWTEVTADLPAGAKYFAIHVTSQWSTALLIDDVTYSPAKGSAAKAPALNQIEGYNVYEDSMMVNTAVVPDTTYTLPVDRLVGVFQVSTIYTNGESALSNAFDLALTGVNSVTTREATVKEVYDVSGKRLSGLRQGINVVRMSDGSWRKIVKR